MMGWAVNSIAEAVEGSIPFLPNCKHALLVFMLLYTSIYDLVLNYYTWINLFYELFFYN